MGDVVSAEVLYSGEIIQGYFLCVVLVDIRNYAAHALYQKQIAVGRADHKISVKGEQIEIFVQEIYQRYALIYSLLFIVYPLFEIQGKYAEYRFTQLIKSIIVFFFCKGPVGTF